MTTQIHTHIVKYFPRRVITPVTGTLALVIGISGGMLFFHLGEGLVKGAHEWLGMLFALVMVVHLLSNWGSLMGHFRQGVARTGGILVLLVAAAFIGTGGLSQPGGPSVVFQALGEAPITSLALLFNVDPSTLIQDLESRGLVIDSADQSIQEVARMAGVNERDAMKQLVSSVGSLR